MHMIEDTAKTILCYGDSNTWGYDPETNARFPRSIRWTGVLQRLLGNEYEVISEGLCGRTFVAEEPNKPHRVGITHLHALIESADPIYCVAIMLGTNDIKNTFNLSVEQIANHLAQTIELIRSDKLDIETISKILVVCPPPVNKPAKGDLDERMVRGLELSRLLPNSYKKVAEENSCDFLNAGDYTSFGKIDGYHLDAEGHLKLAQALYKWLQKI